MRRLKFVENALLNYYLCYNQDEFMLGKIFFHPKSKKYVWEQNKGLLLSRGDLNQLLKFMESIGGIE